MAHDAQRDFIAKTKLKFPTSFENAKVLEVGSVNINGTVRDFFTNPSTYIGLDLAPGNCVDVVCSGHLYDTSEIFDIAISTECFEHDSEWRSTFLNMIRLTKPGGLIVFTCASYNRPEHGTNRTSPSDSLSSAFSDYYMNLGPKEFNEAFVMSDLFEDYYFEINDSPSDLYFWGVLASKPD